MPVRKRAKGTKYQKVTKQQKYIFLNYVIAEQKSIQEVTTTPPRQPFMQGFTTPLPKPSSSSTNATTRTTPPTTSTPHIRIKPFSKHPGPPTCPFTSNSTPTSSATKRFRLSPGSYPQLHSREGVSMGGSCRSKWRMNALALRIWLRSNISGRRMIWEIRDECHRSRVLWNC